MKKDSNSKETLYLCPQHPQTPEYLARTFLKAAQDYDLDGYWLDFIFASSAFISATVPVMRLTPTPWLLLAKAITVA